MEALVVEGAVGLGVEGGAGLAVVVLCAEQLIIRTTTSNRAGSAELHDTISLRQLLQENAGIVVEYRVREHRSATCPLVPQCWQIGGGALVLGLRFRLVATIVVEVVS